MTTKLLNHKNKILNYFPGARGDFLASCLTNLDLNLDRYFKNVLPKSFSKIKSIEKRMVLSTVLEEKVSKNFYNEIISTYTPFIQPCHYVSRLNHNDLNRLTTTHKIYQIVVQSEFYDLIFLNEIIKNSLPEIQNKEELDNYFLNLPIRKNNFLRWIKQYHNEIDYKNITILDFKKIFYPPYEDYITLYRDINESEPNISLFEQKLKQAELPDTIEIFDSVFKIDIENYTIIKL